MVDIRDLLRNQEAKLRQQRTQFWKDALAKQDNEFVDKVVKANRDLIWNHVALLHEIKCEIAAQLGEDTAAELVPEDCTAGIAERLVDEIVEHVVSRYMDGDGEGEGGVRGGGVEGWDGNMPEEMDEGPAVEMDVDEPDVGFASGHGLYDSEAGPSRVESLYEEHISSMSTSASPKPWTREPSSDDIRIVEAEDVPARIKGEQEDTANLWEISRSSPGLLGSRFSPDIQSKSSANSKRSRTTSSRAGGIGASRPVGFEVSPPPIMS